MCCFNKSGVVYFGSDDGNVYTLDATTGNEIWEYKTGGPVESSPAISNSVLYIGSNDGYLYAIGRPASQNPNSKLTPSTSDTIINDNYAENYQKEPLNSYPDLIITNFKQIYNDNSKEISVNLVVENRGNKQYDDLKITYFLTVSKMIDPSNSKSDITRIFSDSIESLKPGEKREANNLRNFLLTPFLPEDIGSEHISILI